MRTKKFTIIFIILLILMVFTGCSDKDPVPEEEVPNPPEPVTDSIIDIIMGSEIASNVGKSNKDLVSIYGPVTEEYGYWEGGLLVAHEDINGTVEYVDSDGVNIEDELEDNSICVSITSRLSSFTSDMKDPLNKEELEFHTVEWEERYYYTFKDSDVPIQIISDESGTIETDPWIKVYKLK